MIATIQLYEWGRITVVSRPDLQVPSSNSVPLTVLINKDHKSDAMSTMRANLGTVSCDKALFTANTRPL